MEHRRFAFFKNNIFLIPHDVITASKLQLTFGINKVILKV
jgi:hypothetical protein